MPDREGQYSSEKAAEEAGKMKELVDTGQASDYPEAKELVEGENKEQELSPEVVEKIMELVQDIDAEGTAYSVLTFQNVPENSKNLNDPSYIGLLQNVLQHGLLGTDYIGETRKRNEGYKEGKYPPRERITPEKWLDNVRNKRQAAVFFNIVGRNRRSYRFEQDSRIQSSFPQSLGGPDRDKITILFDLHSFQERTPTVSLYIISDSSEPNTPKHPQASRTYQIDDPEVIEKIKKGEEFVTSTDDKTAEGKWKSDTEYGFVASYRVAPRFFRGIVLEITRPLTEDEIQEKLARYGRYSRRHFGDVEKVKSEMQKEEDRLRLQTRSCEEDPQLKRQKIQGSVSRMVALHQENHGIPLLPIYDVDGNLWWPREMSYEEVKKFVAARKKGKE